MTASADGTAIDDVIAVDCQVDDAATDDVTDFLTRRRMMVENEDENEDDNGGGARGGGAADDDEVEALSREDVERLLADVTAAAVAAAAVGLQDSSTGNGNLTTVRRLARAWLRLQMHDDTRFYRY